MRFSVRAVAVILMCCLAVLAVYVTQAGEKKKTPAPAVSSSPAASAPAGEDGANPDAPSSAPSGTPEEVLELVAAYGSSEGEDAAWIESLTPYVTPALLASIATSDRELARAAGTEILSAQDTHITVGTPDGNATYVLTIAPRPESHEHTEDTDHTPTEGEWVAVGIDYVDPPAGAALPLGETAVEDLRPTLQDALTVLVAQPGGQTPAAREERIRAVFTAPEEALEITPSGPEEQSIRIGNAHEIVLAGEGQELVAYVTVPYAPDGEDTPSWVTLTVELERTDTGTWAPRDAHA